MTRESRRVHPAAWTVGAYLQEAKLFADALRLAAHDHRLTATQVRRHVVDALLAAEREPVPRRSARLRDRALRR